MVRVPARSSTVLAAIVEQTLAHVGQTLADARHRRRMSASELGLRMGVDRRTVAQLEKGSPTVAIGTFFQALEILGLLPGIEEALRPENDLEAIRAEVLKARQRGRRAKRIPEEKVDF